MTCQDDDQCVSFNCSTTSSGSQCKCSVNAPGSSICDFKFLKDDCNGIGCFWDEKELVETAKCKTRQSKCALDDLCSTDSDCVPGTKCGDENKCIAKCNLLNTDGDCNVGDIVETSMCGRLILQGYYNNRINAPVTDSSMAGTCEQLACVEEGQGCLGDSDCCLGSCDWTMNSGSKMNGVCSTSNTANPTLFTVTAQNPRKMHVSYNQVSNSIYMYGERTLVDKDKGPIIDKHTGRVYDNQTHCIASVEPDDRCAEYSSTATTAGSTAGPASMSTQNLMRIPYIQNGLSIQATFTTAVELEEYTTANNRNTTVAWMPPNTNNEITLAITEDRVGEFFHARKFTGSSGTNNFNANNCPGHGSGTLQYMDDFGTPQYPSDFNLYSCCDFTFLKEGDNIKRLFKSDAHCNQSHYQDGYTSDYPYEESH